MDGEPPLLAAFSRLICSRFSRISDLFDSMVATVSGLAADLLLGPSLVESIGFAASAEAALENLESSTSPSSTSWRPDSFCVETPKELFS